MKKTDSILRAAGALSAAALLVSALPARGADLDRKNSIAAEWRSLPLDYERLLAEEPQKWDFGFRRYNPYSAAMLWSDSTLQRDVVLGGELDGKSPTALYAACDETGFTLLLFAGEPGVTNALHTGKRVPGSSFECFFQPGDAEGCGLSHYYQFMASAYEPTVPGVYPWLMEDRTFRSIEGALQVDARHLANGDVLRVFVPWDPLFDRLPFFGEKPDHIGRLSVIRWAQTGGQTWGGNVHQQSTAGYLVFPDFTEAQQTAIMKRLLLAGWNRYKAACRKPAFDADLLPVNRFPVYVQQMESLPHTFYAPAEDQAFRDAWIRPEIARRDALGPKIADFEAMPFAERLAFYREASGLLFNYHYDLLRAYGEWQENQLFGKAESK